MKKIILLVVINLTGSVFALAADTATFSVKGMHCNGCKKMVTKAVCQDPKLSETFSECKVSVDQKAEVGTVNVIARADKKLDLEAVQAAIQSAGSEYVITLEKNKK